MEKKLRIDELTREPREGMYGPYNILAVYSEGKKYTCIEKAWNKSWQVGQNILVGIEKTKYGFSLVPPVFSGVDVPTQERSIGTQYAHPTIAYDDTEVLNRLSQIMTEVLLIKDELKKLGAKSMNLKASYSKTYVEDPPPHTDEDMPPEVESY